MRGAVQEIARRLKKLGDAAPPDSDGLLEIVLSESDRLDAIITDFLAFARMRPASRADVDVCAVIKEAVVMLEQAAAERGRTDVAIRASCTEELRCRIDAMQFRQVLLNLGLNSIDAVAGRSGAEITLRAEKRAFLDFAAGSEDRLIGRSDPVAGEQIGVAICVEDNGCGMSEDKRRRATEPFFTTKERGTGLGLSVVERVVKAHDGLVRIDSQEGRGTSVHIWVASEG
jgi:two-component system sensor histidine kinase PilS (NtrC family)